jgi:hypothetical protein
MVISEHHFGMARKIIVRICGKCCQQIKVDFMEDLIQITATMEMRTARPHHDTDFERTTRRRLEDRQKEMHEAGRNDKMRVAAGLHAGRLVVKK